MTGLNALIFAMKHPFGSKFQVCSNEVPGFTNGHTLRRHIFFRFIEQKPLKIFFLWATGQKWCQFLS